MMNAGANQWLLQCKVLPTRTMYEEDIEEGMNNMYITVPSIKKTLGKY